MRRSALVLVQRDPRDDASFAEALRVAIGLTLEVAGVEVVLGPEAADAVAAGAALQEEEEVRRRLITLRELGVPVRALAGVAARGGEIPHLSAEELRELVAASDAVLVW